MAAGKCEPIIAPTYVHHANKTALKETEIYGPGNKRKTQKSHIFVFNASEVWHACLQSGDRVSKGQISRPLFPYGGLKVRSSGES